MNFIDDKEKMRDFFTISKDEFLLSYSYLTEQDYEDTINELNKSNRILEFEDKTYKLKVGTYEDTQLLKVSIVDTQTNENKEITMSGIELMFPPVPTPDYVLVDIDKNKPIIDKLLELKVIDHCYAVVAKFKMEELYNYDKIGTMEYLKIHATMVKDNDNKEQKTNSNKTDLQKDNEYQYNQ